MMASAFKSFDFHYSLAEIREQADRIDARRHRAAVPVSLADVEAIIENDTAFCYDTVICLIADLPVVKTKTESVVVQFREEYTPMAPSTVRFVLEEEVLATVAQKLAALMPDAEYGEIVSHVVRVGDGKGFITFSQVATMSKFWLAFDTVYKVVVAVEWLRRQKWEKIGLTPPLNNLGEPSPNLAASVALAVRALPLEFVKTGITTVEGCRLLRFCSGEWLDTTCVVAGLECLPGAYANVGVVTPEFAQMEDEDSRSALIAAHSALDDDTETVIGVMNTGKQTGQHWVAFWIDRTTNSCVLYDPLHSASNLAALQNTVDAAIASQLGVKFKYRAHVGMVQKDGHNCGVLCLLFLELMLDDVEWLPAYSSHMPFFRMRYMKMTYALMRAHGDDEEV